ncbi:Asp-tRNA(Asn)/Glu-tRNA(Gln) amidotransferase subunit GatB [Candidatus Microgenomates bacterium]|nr:Asp-tRNA(Asn)/Glu-tRNA(Gln) amidotransferase subunit GatB [Candidatus Microgenomates bacterium]
MKYQPVIGLEVHVELKTKSKMFCGCSADYFGTEPNTHVCPVCLGLPGALPVPNRQAIDWCRMIGLALNCQLASFSKFDRKNYFYPDLPKGYQISQYDIPFCDKGEIILSSDKKIGITRVHMEEDTAKLMHQLGISNFHFPKETTFPISNKEKYSLIDFNRSGVPLVEIVTEPDFENSQEVVEYLKKLQQIVRYLDVSNADMEKGDMRLEPNISVREISNLKSQISNELPKYKVEVKNINSFRFVEKAINYEIQRQGELLDKGKTPIQETRGYDEVHNRTVSQRTKEEAQDYRYFPEPDIPPIRISESQISNLKSQIPELPTEKKNRFIKDYGLREDQAFQLVETRKIADFFEEAVKIGKKFGIEATAIANIMINKRVDWSRMLPAELVEAIVKSKREDLPAMELENIISEIIKKEGSAVTNYKRGKSGSMEFLVGKVMAQTKGKGNPNQIRQKIIEKLGEKS